MVFSRLARKFWWMALVFAMLACNAATQGLPTETPVPQQNVLPTLSETPLPTASQAPIFTSTPLILPTLTLPATATPSALPTGTQTLVVTESECKSAEQMQADLRTQAQAYSDAGRARDWPARLELTVEKMDVSAMSGKQFACLYAVRLWAHTNPLDNTRNVEVFSLEDMYTFSSIAKDLDVTSYVIPFRWTDSGGGAPRREQVTGVVEDYVGKDLGGLYLWTNKLPTPTPPPSQTSLPTLTTNPSSATSTSTP